jgi:hypothetical protein
VPLALILLRTKARLSIASVWKASPIRRAT